MQGDEILNAAESHFEKDAEGWTLVGDGTLVYLARGGNPDGCLNLRDHVAGISMFYRAPTKFLGDQRGVVRVEWDVKWEPKQSGRTSTPAELKLFRGGTVLRYKALPISRDVWVHRSIPLTADDVNWTKGTVSGPTGPATAGDFDFVLSQLEDLQIRGEFMYGREWTYVDNVVMVKFAEAA